jgi:predicted nucleotidyltransferase
MKHYLYSCFCGPQITRQQSERGHNGYVYENCPAKTAPEITWGFEGLIDFRVPIIVENLENISNIFRKFGCTSAYLIGSFVQNQTKASSDIDFASDVKFEDRDNLDLLSNELSVLLKNPVDITPYYFLEAFPHSAFKKASILVFDDLS